MTYRYNRYDPLIKLVANTNLFLPLITINLTAIACFNNGINEQMATGGKTRRMIREVVNEIRKAK